MDIKTKQAQSIVGTSPGRSEKDFYPTPLYAIKALLAVEEFPEPILEPACGKGDISVVLIKNKYEVFSSDLYYYDWDGGIYGIDFLGDYYKKWSGSLITNPPFNLAEEFLSHALFDLGCKKVALLLKLAFLEGQKRTQLLERTPLKNIWVFRKRILLTRNGEKPRGSGMIAFAWFVWNQGYVGKPTIGWI